MDQGAVNASSTNNAADEWIFIDVYLIEPVPENYVSALRAIIDAPALFIPTWCYRPTQRGRCRGVASHPIVDYAHNWGK